MQERTSLQPHIRRRDAAAEYYTEERCYISELANDAADPAVSIAQARVCVGVTTRWHRLAGIVERYVILSGAGRVEIGESPAQRVGAGDVVVIPAGCRQRIACVGDADLIFLAICTPRFLSEAYEDVDPDPR